MNFRHGLASIFKTIGWAVTLGVAMSACSQASWKEEVLLSDGRKIVVERSVERGGRHEIGQEPPISMQILRFKLPVGGNEIEWKTETSPGIGWADFQPLNVDIVANNAYVVTWPVGCLAYNKWGRPNPPYIVFKHTGKAWQQIPLKDLPSEIKVPNIIFGSPDTNAKQLDKGTISAAAVREVNGRLEQPEYKTILREKINYDPQCIPMVSNGKGVWRATAWFETKPTFDACLTACFHDNYDEKHCPCNSIFQRK